MVVVLCLLLTSHVHVAMCLSCLFCTGFSPVGFIVGFLTENVGPHRS